MEEFGKSFPSWARFGFADEPSRGTEDVTVTSALCLPGGWRPGTAGFPRPPAHTETTPKLNTITVISEGVSHPLNVAEACSGMRMVVAFTALGTFLAATQMTGTVQRTLMVLSAVPVAVAVNILRIVTLGILSLADANFASGEFHHFVGLVWMLPGLLLFLGVQWVINNLIVDERGAKGAV